MPSRLNRDASRAMNPFQKLIYASAGIMGLLLTLIFVLFGKVLLLAAFIYFFSGNTSGP